MFQQSQTSLDVAAEGEEESREVTMGAVKRTHRAARERQQYQKMMAKRLQAHPDVVAELLEGWSRGLVKIIPSVIKAAEEIVKAAALVAEAAVAAMDRMAQDGTFDRMIEEVGRRAIEDGCSENNLQLPEISGGTES